MTIIKFESCCLGDLIFPTLIVSIFGLANFWIACHYVFYAIKKPNFSTKILIEIILKSIKTLI